MSALDRFARLSVSRRFAVFLLLPLFFLIGAPVNAQTESTEEVLRVSTDLLLFTIRVKDKRVAARLSERDLVLKDRDGVTSGLYLSRGADRVAMVFALDQSGSLRDIIAQQKDAALGLYRRFGEQSTIAVLQFAESPTVAAAFGREADKVRSAFSFSARPNQHTAIFDAAIKAIDMFSVLPRVRSERRIVILISDGLDNASRANASAVVAQAREKRVSFYVIHVPLYVARGGRLAVRSPAKGFRDLADKTGGHYFLVDSGPFDSAGTIQLAPIFQAIEDDLKSQYLLGFYLNETANDGRRHTFSLSFPRGVEYQFGELNYSRAHEFFVHRPREFLQRSH